jgi:hypothetical protein
LTTHGPLLELNGLLLILKGVFVVLDVKLLKIPNLLQQLNYLFLGHNSFPGVLAAFVNQLQPIRLQDALDLAAGVD